MSANASPADGAIRGAARVAGATRVPRAEPAQARINEDRYKSGSPGSR